MDFFEKVKMADQFTVQAVIMEMTSLDEYCNSEEYAVKMACKAKWVLADDGVLWVMVPGEGTPPGAAWAVATALRDDGWYLRSEIANTHADEPYSTIFLFAKRGRYAYHYDEVAVDSVEGKRKNRRNVWVDEPAMELCILASTQAGDNILLINPGPQTEETVILAGRRFVMLDLAH